MSMIRSRQVCDADFDRFDLIVAMDAQNMADLRAVQPTGSKARIELFLGHAPEFGATDVPDPYYEDNFELVFDMIEAASRGLLATI